MVRLLGIEPRTSGSTIRRSNQLSYNRTGRARGTMCRRSVPIRTIRESFKTAHEAQDALQAAKKEKDRGEEDPGLFPCIRPAGGGAGLQPAFWWEEDTVPRVFAMKTPQATFSSFSDFSKAVLAGLTTSSAALEEAAWKSLACSTMVSKRWRRKAPWSSKNSATDFTPRSAST